LISFEELTDILAARGATERSITALAGPPAAGKSTLAEQLEAALNRRAAGSAAVLPMDGYHLDDWILVPRGLRPRKGAPETFDVAGLSAILRRLKANDEPEVVVPVFDRSIEIARAGARSIPRSVRHLIVEGNYLLLDQDPWRGLAAYFATTVFIPASLETLQRRLRERWQGHGLAEAEIEAKVSGNDLVNARLILQHSRRAEFEVGTPAG
jgi:pantothenate kinase